MDRIFWTGYCNLERNRAIGEMSNVIGKFGYIVDFKQYADVSIAIQIEVEAPNASKLFHALKDLMQLNGSDDTSPSSNKEIMLFLHVTFIRGTGNLTHEIPAIPG